MSVCVCVCVCVHFIYLYSPLSGMQGPHLGGWDSLLRLHSPCQARWLLSLKEREERWKEKGGRREFRVALNSARVARPQSHHIWRPPAAGSPPASPIPVAFPRAQIHFLALVFPDGGGEGGGSRVFGQAVICAHVSATLVRLCQGRRRRRRWRSEGVAPPPREGVMGRGGGGSSSGGSGGVKA